MKKLLILLCFLGFVNLTLSAQNIYIRGHLQVIYIGPEGMDVIATLRMIEIAYRLYLSLDYQLKLQLRSAIKELQRFNPEFKLWEKH